MIYTEERRAEHSEPRNDLGQGKDEGEKMLKRFATVVAVGAVSAGAVTGVAIAGHDDANMKQHHTAKLKPVPHDPQADHGSNVRGKVHVMRQGDLINVQLKARGLSPNLPHAVHIHGKDAGELAFCPGADRRAGLVDDGLIETAEGVPDYGPVQVSFTTTGDTSEKSVLALDRFPIAMPNGHLNYQRSFSIPSAIAQRLEEKHIVIHGDDLDRDGKYGGRTTALGAPLEGELPVACGELKRTDENR